MRVLHLIKTGFGANWALLQIKELINLGIEVHIALGEAGPMEEKYRAAGAHVTILPIDIARIKNFGWFRAFKNFRILVDKIQPDIIHSHFVGTTIFMRLALWQRPDIKRIFQVPGPLHLEARFPRMLELATASKSDYWIATCEWTSEAYKRHGISANQIFLSYYGNDIAVSDAAIHKEEMRAGLNLSQDDKVVGMVAFMYPPKRWLGQKVGLKGHEDLIEALALLREKRPNIVGVFIGGSWAGADWYRQDIENLAKDKLGESGIFLGTRTDVAKIYGALDVVVHPSHSENVGGAAESLRLGVPTIASNIGGFPDVVIDGETGVLVPPKSPQAIADAIEQTLNNKKAAKAMALAGQTLVAKMFDVKHTGSEVSDIYHAILKADS